MAMYKSFPRANLIHDWNELIQCSRKEVETLLEKWKQIDEENEVIRRQNRKEKQEKIQKVVEVLKAQGIDVYKYKKKGFFQEKNGYQAWFKKNVVDVISKNYPNDPPRIPTAHCQSGEINGIELYNNQSPTNLLELYDRMTRQYQMKKQKLEKQDKLLVQAIAYATKHDLDIEDLSPKGIIDVANDYAKEAYLTENVPNGTKVALKNICSECDTYIMGERRCSCGNRRIQIVVEGNLIDGFYHYPEPY